MPVDRWSISLNCLVRSCGPTLLFNVGPIEPLAGSAAGWFALPELGNAACEVRQLQTTVGRSKAKVLRGGALPSRCPVCLGLARSPVSRGGSDGVRWQEQEAACGGGGV
ncbi:hypothetical protein Droror1_Dr00020021 [Drosera rotundifolia]